MFSLKVEKRELKNQSNNSLRKEGSIPAVYYHKGEESQALKVSVKELGKAMGSHQAVIKLSNHKMAVLKEVQRNPVSGKIIHVSFQGVVAGEKFTKTVSVICRHDENTAWHKEGMILSQSLKEVEIETTPENVPEFIFIDVNALQKGEILRVKDLEVPAGVRILDDEEQQVAHVSFPHIEPEVEPAADVVVPEANEKKEESDKKDE